MVFVQLQAEIILLSSSSNEKAKELGPGVIVEDKKLTADQTNLILVGSNILGRTELLQQALGAIKTDGFLLVRESPKAQLSLDAFHVWVDRVVDGERIMLLRKNTVRINVYPADCSEISHTLILTETRFISETGNCENLRKGRI